MKPMVTDTLPDLARLFCGLVGLLLTILPTDLEMLSVYLVVFFHFRDAPNKMWCPYFEEDSELLYCLQDQSRNYSTQRCILCSEKGPPVPTSSVRRLMSSSSCAAKVRFTTEIRKEGTPRM